MAPRSCNRPRRIDGSQRSRRGPHCRTCRSRLDDQTAGDTTEPAGAILMVPYRRSVARYAGNLRGRVAVVPSRSQRRRPGAGCSFAFSILFSVVMNGHCCPCAHAGDKRIGGMPPRRQRRLAHRELSRAVAVSGYSRPPPGYGFTGGTLRGEGEQAKSSSRLGDCDKPHQG